MKHTIIHLVGLGAACLLLAGCDGYESGGIETTSGTSLQLEVVERLTIQSDVNTRATAGYEEVATAGEKMGLFRKAANPVYTALSNVPYIYETPEWQPEGGDGQTVWLHATQNADIAACYPYNASLSFAAGKENEGIINLNAALRNPTKPQDLWYNHLQANGKNCKKNLQLNQAYCRMQLTFLIDKSVSYVTEPYLYKLTIAGGRASATSTTDGIFSTCTLDLFKDAASAYTRITKEYSPVDITADTYRITDAAGTTGAALDLLMIPATLSAPVTLTVAVGAASGSAKTMSVSIPAADFGGSLQGGKIYKVTVKIKGTDIGEFSTVTTDWSPATSGNINFNNPVYN